MCPCEKSLFRSKYIQFSHKCIDLNLKCNFAIINLQNKHNRYDFRSKLTILCQFCGVKKASSWTHVSFLVIVC